MPILKVYENSSLKVTLFGSLVPLQDTFLLLNRLHGETSCLYLENTNQSLLLINEIGADVFKAAENTKVHIEIELS